MISNPHTGQAVQIWYGQRTRSMMPLHGRLGVVVIAGRGRPRNHVVLVDGERVIVPAGNLRPVRRTRLLEPCGGQAASAGGPVGNNAVAWVE